MGGYLLINSQEKLPIQHGMNNLIVGLCFLAAIIAFISDLIFRKFIPLLRNLWVVECAFIVFTVALTVILRLTIA